MGIELSDLFVTLTPRKRWKRARTQAELVGKMEEALRGLPGMRMVFTQPIEMRVNEMVAGIRADVGVKIFGDDLDLLRVKATEIDSLLRTLPGSADVSTEQITGQPVLEVRLDPRRLSRYGISAKEALAVVEAIGGKVVGEVREGDRRFDLAVSLAPVYRTDPDAVRRLLLSTATGERVPLGSVASISDTTGPSTITREWGKRRVVVQSNVRGRDVEGYVSEVRERIDRDVVLPAGYFVRFGGQFEHLERARTRLLVVVPAALALIFALLYLAHRSARDALLLFTGVPFAAVGGIVALAVRGMPFTISAGVGFIALSGVAVLNGLVLVSAIRALRASGRPLPEAVREGALSRLRPVLMTALVASLGFLPMALSTGVGAEIQRPLATTVIGGVVSSTLLTLVVFPVLYAAFGTRQARTE
jgi:cobalt-zinc-cadmium resistance protein CzcA